MSSHYEETGWKFELRAMAFGDFPAAVTDVQARALVTQPDGHVVIVGSVRDQRAPEGRYVGLIRFDKTGKRDTQFGTEGYKVLDLGGVDNVARALALQADGKLIIAGEISSRQSDGYSFASARLDSDGRLDSEFSGGVVTTEFPHEKSGAYAVAVQSDGKLVAAGYTSYSLPNAPGRSESVDAQIRIANARRADKDAQRRAMDDDDDRTLKFDREERERWATAVKGEAFAVVRYAADGTLDESFDLGGRVITAMQTRAGGRARARALQVQPDGRLVVAGFATPGSEETNLAIARYLRDGSLDESLGGGKKVFSAGGKDESAHALALQPDGKIIIAGAGARDSRSSQHFLLARLDQNGNLDPTFGDRGFVINRDFVGVARAVVVLPDGRIVAAGGAAVTGVDKNGDRISREQPALVCYLPDGSVQSFGSRTFLRVELGGTDDSLAGIAASGSKIFIAGTSRVGTKSEFAVLCLE